MVMLISNVSRTRFFVIVIISFIVYFFPQGETHGGSKITKVNYKTCLVVNPILACRHLLFHVIMENELCPH